MGAGIGFFIAFIGLKNAGIVVADAHSIASLGNFASARVLLGFVGILFTIILVKRRVRGALMVSILLITAVGNTPAVRHTGSQDHTDSSADFRLAAFDWTAVSQA